MSELRFDGECAVITGAGHGLGRGAALELASRGAHVIVNDLPKAGGTTCAADRVVDEIRAAGGRASAVSADAVSPSGIEALAAAAQEHGGASVLVHSAALIRRVALADLSPELLRQVVETNLTGSVLLLKALLGQLRANQGRVVLFGSGAGMFGLSGQVAYGGTKAGLVGVSRCLADELADDLVRVNVVLPYAVTNPGRTTLDWPPADLELVAARGTVEHVAALVTVLSHQSTEVTGRVYSAMGGRYARVVTALAPGWAGTAGQTTRAEDLRDAFGLVDAGTPNWIPSRFEDELIEVARLLRRGS